MSSDEDLIIAIPDDEPDPVTDEIPGSEDDTPVEVEAEAEQPQAPPAPDDAPATQTWPAIKLYHPMMGAGGTPGEVPEGHEVLIAANIMLGPVGAPLREGASNIVISGRTPEDVAQELTNIILAVFEEMREQTSPIHKPTPEEMARLRAEMEARQRGR